MSDKSVKTIEQELKQSRANLSKRWNSLGLEVINLTSLAKEDVTETLRHARETVSIHHQVTKRPWAILGGAVLTGIALSRFRGIRGLALLTLAAPLVKNALSGETSSNDKLTEPSLETTKSGKSADATENDNGFLQVIRLKTINSLGDIAKELVQRNAPTSLRSVMDEAITNSVQRLVRR